MRHLCAIMSSNSLALKRKVLFCSLRNFCLIAIVGYSASHDSRLG